MKRLAFFVLAALLCAGVAQAFELGGGLTYFADSEESAPYISMGIHVSPVVTFWPTWVQDGAINHLGGELGMDLYAIEDIFLYVHGGAGLAWDDFDQANAELVYGVGLRGDVWRVAYTARTQGGETDTQSAYSLGVYLLR